jgi:hypothetical protein
MSGYKSKRYLMMMKDQGVVEPVRAMVGASRATELCVEPRIASAD